MNSESTQGTGYLSVRVSTARGAIPLEGAQVQVRSLPKEGASGTSNLLQSAVTGRDGRIPLVPLPAPPREESLRPQEPGVRPYATYLLDVYLEGYFHQSYIGVPIFDGVIAIQAVDLIPLTENQAPDGYSPSGDRVIEAPGRNSL